jgi:hypothetical protein
MNLFFSNAAQENIRETGADVESDAEALRAGSKSPAELLAHCLDGADADRRQGWLDYVNELARAVFAEDRRVFEPISMPEE